MKDPIIMPCKMGRDVLVFAFRYAISRETGICKEVFNGILLNRDKFQIWEFKNMLDSLLWEMKHMENDGRYNFHYEELGHIKRMILDILEQRESE